jgi:hypothetical protein
VALALKIPISIVLALVMLTAPAAAQSVIYVDIDATGADDGTSWADAFVFLQDALAVAKDGDEVWVAEGVYRPDLGAGLTVGDRTAVFVIEDSILLLGGFSGIESARASRDWVGHPTILSGDILGNDVSQIVDNDPSLLDNSEQILSVGGASHSQPIVIDGLTITGAFGRRGLEAIAPFELIHLIVTRNRSAKHGAGGLIVGPLGQTSVIRDSRFIGNESDSAGGGLHAVGEGISLRGVYFEGNRGGKNGGALFLSLASISVFNCVFVGNSAADGGAIESDAESSIYVVNSTFIGNSAWTGGAINQNGNANRDLGLVSVNSLFAGNSAMLGGAISSDRESVAVLNSTITDNSASVDGGAFYLHGDGTSLRSFNSIIWNNGTPEGGSEISLVPGRVDASTAPSFVGYSLLTAAPPELVQVVGGVVYSNPLFVDPLGDDGIPGTGDEDFHLLSSSPAIDTGANSHVPSDSLDIDEDADSDEPIPGDRDLHYRVFDGGAGVDVVDMGAYEAGSPPLGMSMEGTGYPAPEEWIELHPPYPNPFRGSTNLRFSVSAPGRLGLILTDALGRQISTVFESIVAPGVIHEIRIAGGELSPGVYFLRPIQEGVKHAAITLVRY